MIEAIKRNYHIKLRLIHEVTGKIAKILTITQLIMSGVNRQGSSGGGNILWRVSGQGIHHIYFEIVSQRNVVPSSYLKIKQVTP